VIDVKGKVEPMLIEEERKHTEMSTRENDHASTGLEKKNNGGRQRDIGTSIGMYSFTGKF